MPTLRYFRYLTFLVRKRLTKTKGRISTSYCATLEKKSKEFYEFWPQKSDFFC